MCNCGTHEGSVVSIVEHDSLRGAEGCKLPLNFLDINLLESVLVEDSLCRGQERRTMRESEVQIGNSGLILTPVREGHLSEPH